MTSAALFISGTDTDVGKTVVSAVLCELLRRRGHRVAYFKPVQSGAIAAGSHIASPDVKTVRAIAPDISTACGYLLDLPAAPQLAAERSQPPVQIEFDPLDRQFRDLRSQFDIVLVEGAGGLAVPLARHLSTVDLIQRWQLPLVLVSRPNLGTINHTVLSVEYARQHHLNLLATAISYARADLDPDDPICATAPRFIAQLCSHVPAYMLPFHDWEHSVPETVWLDLDNDFAPLLSDILRTPAD
ncbi:MAG: dethiobiotin synthase [Cyanobacteria bacterium J06648_11]